jgi:MoaA/NifB/PqqE/SkfB family radical SAM enzyme
MFKFNQLKAIHVELTNNCQASCPMCARNNHGGLPNPNINITEITLEHFKKIFSQEVLTQIDHIYFCGNYGDPILSNYLLEIISYCSETNPQLHVAVHTNGSARTAKWWRSLYRVLPEKHCVHFALDGLEDTHHLYRTGTDFNKIIDNAKEFIACGGTAEWVFLSFKHNEHQIEQARTLATRLGFKSFSHKATGRFLEKPWFDVVDSTGQITYKIEPPTEHKITFVKREVIENYKHYVAQAEIQCGVSDTKEVYVDAYGHIWPCCFIGAVPYTYATPSELTHTYHKETKDEIKNLLEYIGNNDLRIRSIQDTIDSSEWQSVWSKYWSEKKLSTCARTCGKFPEKIITQYGDQFLKVEEISG